MRIPNSLNLVDTEKGLLISRRICRKPASRDMASTGTTLAAKVRRWN
jgi:hypothetical protein